MVRPSADFNRCAEQVYAAGVEIGGITYTSWEAVSKLRSDYIHRKIMVEKKRGKEVLPPYQDKLDAKYEEVLDCLAQ